ncbi:MAG TPA: phytanoyl-CoA dioxygenase family protein, partial [Tepidisphaeraceae bacterium]|nr:phytanoyl-CoA dioxygenase family protein [Tepidisphaeraceae bacterium]
MKTLAKKQFTPSALESDLDGAYPVTPEQIAKFRQDGYVKLKNVFAPATLGYYGKEITEQVLRLNNQTKPMSERTTYEKAFLQIMNIWTHSEVVKEFVFGKKLGRLAAELMGVKGVRIYHDQALYKEPGGGFTPWHADQYYWPLSNANSVTAWIPLQAVPLEMGP